LLRIELERQKNRPDRKVYHLTKQGRETFLDWVGEPVPSLRAVRVELLAKLRFYDWLDLSNAAELIHSQQEIFLKMITEWEEEKDGEKDPFLGLVYDFRISQAKFINKWLETYQKRS